MLCLAITIGFFLYRAGNDAAEVLARNALMETMSRIDQATDHQLQGVRQTLRVVAPNPIPQLEKNAQPIVIPFPQNEAALQERLWLANGLCDDPSNAYFGGVDGSFVGLKEEQVNRYRYSRRDAQGKNNVYYLPGPGVQPQLIATQEFDARTRPWYISAMERQQETWSPVFRDYRVKDIGISLSKPVYTQDHVLLGVAGSSIGLGDLGKFLRELPLGKNGVAFIVDMDGNLIATSINEPIADMDDVNMTRRHAAQSGSALARAAYASLSEDLKVRKLVPGEVVLKRLSGDDAKVELAYRLYHDDAGLDWIEVGALSRSDFLGSVTGGVYQTLLLGLAAVCITFILGFAILRWVLRDIRKLTLAAKSIGNGEPFPALNIDRKDEIGQLAQSFQEMEHSLRTDRLTGVLNRDSFIAQIDFRRSSGTALMPVQFALLFIDLDKFKAINDQ